MSIKFRKILVTCALPYANGPIHIGHMLEHIQADIWVRYQRMKGHEVWFISADDAHGTAIMLRSKNLNISEKKLIKNIHKDHKIDFINFNISYDNYHTTHSVENLFLLRKIFASISKKQLFNKKIISQFYDNVKKIFLPDRLIKGTCPICYAKNQYGDACEACSSTYEPTDLINSTSVISGTSPILRDTEHLYFNLPVFSNMLNQWIHSGVLEKSVIKKAEEWLKLGLKKWCISRDKPYFGFKIPNFINKYFYVWMDAPIGYISTFKNLCVKNKNLNFNEFWNKNSKCELYHFIGKDIMYFHTLFWPSILEAVDFRKPSGIFVHGHVTINGLKLSKSRNIFITAKNWLKYFDVDSLRYYYASKLTNNINDIEINLNDFMYKINSDIVNKLVNLASRSSSFINKYFDGYLSDQLHDNNLYNYFINSRKKIENFFESRKFSLIIQKCVKLLDIANQYINENKPWKIKQNIKKNSDLHLISTMGINLFRIIMIFLTPIIPNLSKKTELFLISHLRWDNIQKPLLSQKIKNFPKLYERISSDKILNISKLFN
ncbi:Methionine--tRNA ligase [Buchnera aphidicola (Protaphis terricola)]|uniref:methionine--tRNA ligase n=1 Tax=Buchnera aphidicola TaxID=9 RepID=UPI00346393CD